VHPLLLCTDWRSGAGVAVSGWVWCVGAVHFSCVDVSGRRIVVEDGAELAAGGTLEASGGLGVPHTHDRS